MSQIWADKLRYVIIVYSNWWRVFLLLLPRNVHAWFLFEQAAGVLVTLVIRVFPGSWLHCGASISVRAQLVRQYCDTYVNFVFIVYLFFSLCNSDNSLKAITYFIIQISSKHKNKVLDFRWIKVVSHIQMYRTFALYYSHSPHTFFFTGPILAALTLETFPQLQVSVSSLS